MSRSQPTAHDDPALTNERALAESIFRAEAAGVAGLAGHLGPEFHQAIDLIERAARRGGSVLVTGLGKSGLIGTKISATLASLGIASHFVHPTEAAHGDLGNFRKQDVVLALSYSGESDEVIALCAILQQDGIPVISISAGPTPAGKPSGLMRVSTINLAIGRVEEDAEISPAPTVSTTATLALGDALALCASRRLQFTHDDFVKRHPGGSLGGLMRPITEALRFVVGKSLNPVPDDVSVAEACKLSETPMRRPGAMLLVDRATGKLTGLFTDADLRRLIERDRSALDLPVREVMTKNPGTLPDSARVRDAVRMVREFRRDEIPVVDPLGVPVGMLDVQDLIAMRLVRE
jgi:arabinose-5-phosphate isomerase